MCDDRTKCDDCSPEQMIEEIEACGFDCIMGDLKDNRGWIALKKRVADLQALFKSNCKVESIAIDKCPECKKGISEFLVEDRWKARAWEVLVCCHMRDVQQFRKVNLSSYRLVARLVQRVYQEGVDYGRKHKQEDGDT